MASSDRKSDFCAAVTSFFSWLARLLASLFKRSGPLEELPIVTSGSQQTMALLEAFHAENHNSQARPRPHTQLRHPPIEKKMIRSATSSIHAKSFDSMPVAREKPLSNYPTAFRWTAPPEDDNWESVRDACPLNDNDKVHSGIGNLGQRRGFKGKPLTVSKWSRSSLFLSLPKGLNFSPRSSSITSLDGAFPSSPRTPLGAVANRMRSVSVSVVSWSSGAKTPVPTLNEVSQDLQDLYDMYDPFASGGDTFFVPITDINDVPTPDLCQLGFYRQYGMTRKQSCIVKKNTPLQDALHSAFTNARMKTTIYDLSTADVVPARVPTPSARNTAAASLDVPERGLDIVDGVIAATSPTIVLTAPPSPKDETKIADESDVRVSDDTRELSDTDQKEGIPELEENRSFAKISNTSPTIVLTADKDETNPVDESPVSDLADNDRHILEEGMPELGLKEENKIPRSALAEIRNVVPPFKRNQHDISSELVSPVTVYSSDNDFGNVQPPTFQYAEFPKVVYESYGPYDDVARIPTSCLPLSAPQRRSSLRPLVLPARVASRLSARGDMDRRPQALEDIIALLNVELTAQ